MANDRSRPTAPRPDIADPTRRDALRDMARLSLAAVVAAALPRVRAAHAAIPTDLPIETWRGWAAAGRAALLTGVDAWADGATLSGGVVNGTSVFLPPGALSGPSFANAIDDAMMTAGAPAMAAAAFAGASWSVWDTWAASFHMTVGDAFPTFVAIPAPEVPETEMPKQPLENGLAPGRVGLTMNVLPLALAELLGEVANESNVKTVIAEYSLAYVKDFRRWFRRAKIVNALGKGSVPTFAPPYVPVGPVVNGTVTGAGVIRAPAFGAD